MRPGSLEILRRLWAFLGSVVLPRVDTWGCNGFNDCMRAVRVETGESYCDTLPFSTFVPRPVAAPATSSLLDAVTHVSHASCISFAGLRFPSAAERLSRGNSA
jgi:hypothetical protein